MTTGVHGPERAAIEERTLRTDRWWLSPLTTFVVFGSFVVYATIRAFMGSDYYAKPYLSPFYSPCLGDCVEGASDFGQPFGWWPLSAALIILIFPLGFRMTCYYYRKAYYRAFWFSPPACGVAEPHAKYSGETRFPLILQNVHRWFWYAAVVVGLVLTYDVFLAFRAMPAEYAVGDGETCGVHMGLGTLLMIANVGVHLALHALVPLVPPHRGRPDAALLQAPGALQALDLGVEAEREPRQVGVVLPVLGGDRRPLRLPRRQPTPSRT